MLNLVYFEIVMQNKISKYAKKLNGFLSSDYFFWFIIFLFVFQAVWMALSFRYPMLFDEYYHLGLIQHFSHQWLPWVNDQPTSLDLYGALGRSPYLLYHYLMSFPFRAVALFTNDLNLQIIMMRLVNIGIFAGGLVIFAQIFKVMKIQSIFRNIALLFLVLLPVTPFVAATINYDSAMFLLAAALILIAIQIINSEKIQWYNYVLIVLIGMMGSMIKISFVPIFAVIFLFIFIRLFTKHKKRLLYDVARSFRGSSLLVKVAIFVPFIIVGFIFTERFAVNIVKYHTLAPSCAVQMDEARCLANPTAARNENFIKNKKGVPARIPSYAATWYNNMVYSSLYTGSNTDDGAKIGQPLPIIYVVVFIGSIISLAAFFYSFREIEKLSGFWLLITIILVYITALFYTTISAYYKYYVPLAIQGRYLLPLLPVIMVFALLSINYVMQKKHVFKLSVLAIALVLFLNGAGIITHIMRSDDSWYWDNKIVHQVNDGTRKLLKPLVLEQWYDR